MSQKTSVEVNVAGQQISLKTDLDQSEVQATADLVNEQMKTLGVGPSQMTNRHYLLLSMVLAASVREKDKELESLRVQVAEFGDTDEQFRAQVRERSRAILEKLDSQFALTT